MIVAIYHSRDLDGYSSGAIIKRKYPEAKLVGYDYGQPIPYDKIPKGVPIIMADVSLPMPDMVELANYSGNQLTWIDHHISAINDYQTFLSESCNGEPFLTAVLENGIAACEGTWKYLFPDEAMPEAIKLLGEYDTWRNQDKDRWERRILPLQFGMRIHCNSAETFVTDVIGPGGMSVVNRIVDEGVTVLKYQAQVNETQCKKAFEFEFYGQRAICLNGGGFNSDVFKSVYDGDKHDIMMPFQYNGKTNTWTFSMYSVKPEVDCSAIAKQLGGGGHKGAAGFQVEDISTIFPFLKNK